MSNSPNSLTLEFDYLFITVPITVIFQGTAITGDGYDKMVHINTHSCDLEIPATSSYLFID